MGKLTDHDLTRVYMNLGIPSAISKYVDLPFDGIGLLRIEFTIASAIGVHPLKLVQMKGERLYVDKLVEEIEKVASVVYPRPIVVRFSDFKTDEYRNLEGGDEFEGKEKNPMMGWRGASRYISQKYGQVFKLECEVISRLRERHSNIWAMIPFVRTLWEAKKSLEIVKEEGLKSTKKFKIWLMVEVPSVALLIDEFNKLPIDGYSIGSNDLCQFVLGVDRDNTELLKMGYFDERNLAVMKMMKMIVEGAHRGGKTCSICGEAVSNYEEIISFLFHLRIDSMSVEPDAVIKVKQLLRRLGK